MREGAADLGPAGVDHLSGRAAATSFHDRTVVLMPLFVVKVGIRNIERKLRREPFRRGASLQPPPSCFTLQWRLADSPNLQVRHLGEGAL